MGLVLSVSALGLLQSWLPASMPRSDQIVVDRSMILFVLVMNLCVGLLLGAVPAMFIARRAVSGQIVHASRDASGLRGESNFLGAILTAEVAIALGLTITSALLPQSMWRSTHVDSGFDWRNVVTIGLSFPREQYDGDRIVQSLSRVQEAVRSVDPSSVFGWSTSPPFLSTTRIRYWTDVQPPPAPDDEEGVLAAAVFGDYFEALAIPLVSGRFFDRRDSRTAAAVCIVNRAFADRHWPQGEAIGRHITVRGVSKETMKTVIGVVGNIKQESPVSNFVEKIYLPFAQDYQFYGTIVLETSQDLHDLTTVLKSRIAQSAPDAPIDDIQTLKDSIDDLLAQRLFFTRLFSTLALAAVVLALTGIINLVQFGVTRRFREIGVRVVLGARPTDIVKLVLTKSLWFTSVGLGVGLGIAMLSTGYVSSWLYGLAPTDPLTFGGVALIVFLTAMASASLPTRQALRLEPGQALRAE